MCFLISVLLFTTSDVSGCSVPSLSFFICEMGQPLISHRCSKCSQERTATGPLASKHNGNYNVIVFLALQHSLKEDLG